MTSPLPDRDLDLLSAYLDNQLPQTEKVELDRRLVAEPELEEALRGLRATVQALQSLPTVKAPRNFVLDPKVYGRPVLSPQSSVLSGWLRLATALAMFLFVVVVAGDFVSQSRTPNFAAPEAAVAPAGAERTMPEPATEPAALEAPAPAPTEAPALAAAPVTEEQTATAEAAGGAGAVGAAVESQSLAAPTEGVKSATTAAASADLAAQATSTPPLKEMTPAPGVESEATPTPTETPAVVAQAVPTEAAQIADQTVVRAAAPPPFNWWRVGEIALGLLVLGLGLTTFWWRRKT